MQQSVGFPRIVLAYLNLAYLYALYFGVGLTQEGFYLSKGNIWLRIDQLDRAIRCYHKSLEADDNPRVRAFLGWCYSRAGNYLAALENYRSAYQKRPRADIALGLASLEFASGDKDRAFVLLRSLQDARGSLDAGLLAELKRLEDKFGAS